MRQGNPPHVNTTFRLRADLVKRARKKAIDDDLSFNRYVEGLIERDVGAAREEPILAYLEASRRAREGRRREHGGRFPKGGALGRDETYER